jgi:hypothetical protein
MFPVDSGLPLTVISPAPIAESIADWTDAVDALWAKLAENV